MKYNRFAIALFMRITEKLKNDPSFSPTEKINQISEVAKFYKKDLVSFMSREDRDADAFTLTY